MKIEEVLSEDFKSIANSRFLDIEKFRDKSILITGATGLIGSLLTKLFLFLNETENFDVKIFAVVRNTDKAKNLYRDFDLNNLNFIVCDLSKDSISVAEKIDFIIHTAAVTNSKYMISNPIETIKTSIEGTENVLKLATKKKVDAMVYLSSMEVYGVFKQPTEVQENTLGEINLTDVRSSYPESKRLCELLCTSYYKEYGLNVKAIRLAQVFGAGVLETDNRVFAQFAKSAMSGENIILHTTGNSEGNYVYTSDALQAILLLLLKGQAGIAYNVANKANHTTIKKMAELVQDSFGEESAKVIVDFPKENLGYAPETHIKLNSDRLRNLGWYPKINLHDSYERLIRWYQEH